MARKDTDGDQAERMRALIAGLDASALSEARFHELLAVAGIEGERLPERMQGINEILNALPAPLTEQLLVEYINRLYRQP